MQEQKEYSLIKTYATAMFILALLNEWNKAERIGVSAKIYNRLIQKHNNFYKQINEVERGKKKSYSDKCSLCPFLLTHPLSRISFNTYEFSTHKNLKTLRNLSVTTGYTKNLEV